MPGGAAAVSSQASSAATTRHEEGEDEHHAAAGPVSVPPRRARRGARLGAGAAAPPSAARVVPPPGYRAPGTRPGRLVRAAARGGGAAATGPPRPAPAEGRGALPSVRPWVSCWPAGVVLRCWAARRQDTPHTAPELPGSSHSVPGPLGGGGNRRVDGGSLPLVEGSYISTWCYFSLSLHEVRMSVSRKASHTLVL